MIITPLNKFGEFERLLVLFMRFSLTWNYLLLLFWCFPEDIHWPPTETWASLLKDPTLSQKAFHVAYKWNVLNFQLRKVEWSMVYINCQCYDSMIIYLPGASFDRAHVQLVEVRSGTMVLSITIRLYFIDDHFVSINSKCCLQRTKCKLQKMN